MMPMTARPIPALRYRAGFVDITPGAPIPLAGYARRTAPFAGIADPLEANAAILSDDTCELVLISFDLLYVGALLRQRLEQALCGIVAPAHLFLAASHTHFAPATDPTLPALGATEPAYLDFVVARVVDLVQGLRRQAPKELELGVAQGRAVGAVNRRWHGWRLSRRFPFLRRGVFMSPSRRGPRDERVRVARLGTDALIWCYACHPVLLPRLDHVSADYIGTVRAALRHRYGADTTVLFWQGFSGDLYPSFMPHEFSLAAYLLHRFVRRADSVAPRVWRRWTDRLAAQVSATLDRATPRPATGRLHACRIALPIRELLGPPAPDKRLWAHELQLGTDLHVLGMSAEPAVAYLAAVRQALGDADLFAVGCTDGVFGYLPTAPMLGEGGYEAAEFFPAFALQGAFRPDIERVIHDRLLSPLCRPEDFRASA